MSMYYKLTCDEHKEYCDAFCRKGSPVGYSEETLTTFMWAHCNCKTELVWDNHNEDKLYDGSHWIYWTADNVDELERRGVL